MRLNSNLRDLLAEVRLSTNDLIQPLFIKEGLSGKEAIESMPNINRYGQDSIFSEIEDLLEHDINTIALFPVINDSWQHWLYQHRCPGRVPKQSRLRGENANG